MQLQSAEGFHNFLFPSAEQIYHTLSIKSGEDMLEFKLEKENSPESEFRDPFRMPMVIQNQIDFQMYFHRI